MTTLDLFTSQRAFDKVQNPTLVVEESDDNPHENPAITIAEHFFEESLDIIDDAIELSQTFIPQTSIPKKLSWIKRKLMWFKRKYKQYKVWSHKLGKFELEPKVRAGFRANRQLINALSTKVASIQSQLDQIQDQLDQKDY